MTTPAQNPNTPPTPANPAPDATLAGASTTERAVALATSAAPLITGITAPLLADNAAFLATIAYGGAGGFLAANFMNRLPDSLLTQIPGADIIRAHRVPLFASTLTSGMALAVGTLGGPAYSDALIASITTLPSIPGILSLGWWAGVALAPLQLRRVLRRPRKTTPAHPTPTAPATYAPNPQLVPFTTADEIYMLWGQHISDPTTGSHKAQELTLTDIRADRWTGIIKAPLGTSVNVTAEKVSSVYQVSISWVFLRPGNHAGEQHITVHRTPPPALDPSTLAGAWAKRVARTGGVLAHTHLEDIQDDPNTGGKVALVVADEDLDKLPLPDRASLAGALRTTPLLVSYEPRQNPREAVIRIMDHNPLQEGVEFPGVDVLKPNPQGYIRLGRGISGFPARIQIHDPQLGAQHVLIAGVTGSGKGGTLQLIALSHHVNGSAIIYADPKGSSNPAIDSMAAYSGLGPDNALGALRVWYALLQHRVAESARLGMAGKNFQSSPDRPWAPLILDEASKLLGENAAHRKEATYIVNAGATLGRSLGMPVILANQLMQLAQLGGDAAIRDNIFYGGSLILLRSDSQQKHLVDLPENFAGCDPSDIPAAWSEDRALVFDPDTPENDPRRTFGLGYTASPGAHAEMMRNWLLEDATPYINPAAIAYPADWPDWDRRDEIAATPVTDDGVTFETGTDGNLGGLPPSLLTTPKKPENADDKILDALRQFADPLGIDLIYVHRDQISGISGVEGQTFNNALTRLTKAGKVHRQPGKNGQEVRGMYGLGPSPSSADDTAPPADSDSSD